MTKDLQFRAGGRAGARTLFTKKFLAALADLGKCFKSDLNWYSGTSENGTSKFQRCDVFLYVSLKRSVLTAVALKYASCRAHFHSVAIMAQVQLWGS